MIARLASRLRIKLANNLHSLVRTLHAVYQNPRNLSSRELFRRHLPLRKHLADLGSRQRYVIRRVMRAGLVGRHRLTAPAEEGMIEKHRRDAQQVRIELSENIVRVISAIVAP